MTKSAHLRCKRPPIGSASRTRPFSPGDMTLHSGCQDHVFGECGRLDLQRSVTGVTTSPG